MKFFNIDLHISIIADMRKIFTDLNHEVTDWSLSDHTWVFNRQRANIPMLDNNRWRHLSPDEFSNDFYRIYKNQMEEYDAFIVTYPPPFALLYKHFNKPIIINNPIRYEWPFSFRKKDWLYFNDFLRDGVDNGQIILVANNLFDKKYMEDFIERDVQHIPSLCDYYNQYYNPTKDDFLYYSKGKINEITASNIIYKGDLFSKHKIDDLVAFNGLIHMPYQISYMSIFEQYTANIPLFVPNREFLLKLFKDKCPGILKEVSWNYLFNEQNKSFIPYNGQFDPNDMTNFEGVYEWLKYSDFYDEKWMPYITQFESFEHLENLVNHVDTRQISNNMKLHNETKKEIIYNMWDNLINKKIK
jgi:hypothetical protein